MGHTGVLNPITSELNQFLSLESGVEGGTRQRLRTTSLLRVQGGWTHKKLCLSFRPAVSGRSEKKEQGDTGGLEATSAAGSEKGMYSGSSRKKQSQF